MQQTIGGMHWMLTKQSDAFTKIADWIVRWVVSTEQWLSIGKRWAVYPLAATTRQKWVYILNNQMSMAWVQRSGNRLTYFPTRTRILHCIAIKQRLSASHGRRTTDQDFIQYWVEHWSVVHTVSTSSTRGQTCISRRYLIDNGIGVANNQ